MNAYQQLEKIFEKIAYLEHLQAITSWDEAAMMPSGGGNIRGQALSTLGVVIHEMLTSTDVGKLIENAKKLTLEPSWQQPNLKWMERAFLNAIALPKDLVRALTETRIQSEQAWRVYRAENNWKDFAPLLEKTLNLVKESAQIRGDYFKKSAYDVLLDDNMPSITQAEIDPIFTELKKDLLPLIPAIIDKQRSRHTIAINGIFPIEKQKQLATDLMQAIGFDFNHGRVDVSHHPFCGGDPEDVRITTRYHENDFISAIMAVCHETGHARYEQGLPRNWLRQLVGRAQNIAIHESQSLITEMQACRSREFMNFLSPLVKRYFGDEEAFNADNLHMLYTQVAYSYIRVDADEVTYPLHVILRYELEKALFAGKLRVADLPEAWDAAMQSSLQLSTKNNYKNGVMQDVHWPAGMFGYFPAYTLGSATAAQLFASAKKQHPEIPTQLSQGNFTGLFDWLGKNVHQRASSMTYSQLMQDATGETLTSKYFIAHVKNRYL
jgi:carboxypeptidase Taq